MDGYVTNEITVEGFKNGQEVRGECLHCLLLQLQYQPHQIHHWGVLQPGSCEKATTLFL